MLRRARISGYKTAHAMNAAAGGGMKAIRLFLASAALLAAAATPVWADRMDPPLAGDLVVSDTHGQPFCTDRESLRRYTVATVRHEQFPPGGFPTCTIAPYGAHVRVLQDLPPYGSLMHMVRAQATTLIQHVEGYTWSVGLYDARRFSKVLPYGELFPQFP